MVKYIHNLVQELKNRLAGMKANDEKWVNQSVSITEVEDIIQHLQKQESKMDAIETELQKERAIARKIVETYKVKLKQVDNLASGIHFEEPVKLSQYGLKQKKTVKTKSVPEKIIILSIVDDTDGEGFVIKWKRQPKADYYEIERGISPNIQDLILTPPYPFLKTSTKTTTSDKKVEKGIRYFYRVRGVNRFGAGEWSEPVNKTQ